MKLTKIVCTIGPASKKREVLTQLMRSGMNVARLNFSHGTHRDHAELIRTIRAAASSLTQEVAIIQDLQGPRIRIGDVGPSPVVLVAGSEITLVPQEMYHASKKNAVLPSQYAGLSRDVHAGNHILIADGTIDMKVIKVRGPEIHCVVVIGGTVSSHKGMNIPHVSLHVAAVTEKDHDDMLFGVQQGVDYMALSFVRSGKDIVAARAYLKKLSKRYPKALCTRLIAKIERPEAVHAFHEIVAAADAIMIARGDLGIEMEPEKVPIVQKDLIKKCMAAGKPVIVATQMLESMIQNRRPTRAEASDVANAVIDHTDAVMLSGESASGAYPVETVRIMEHIIKETERSTYDDFLCTVLRRERHLSEAIAHALADIAFTKTIAAVALFDIPHLTRLLACHRPEVPLISFNRDPFERRSLVLVRGVLPYAPLKGSLRLFVRSKKIISSAHAVILCVEKNQIRFEDV